MIDTLEFINGHVNIYCGYNILTYNINDLYIVRYMGAINREYSFEYILYVKGKEDKFILSHEQLHDAKQKGIKIL